MSRREGDGRVGEIAARLAFIPMAAQTHYQMLCIRLGELVLDLPVPEWRGDRLVSNKRMRESDRLNVWAVNRWILEVTTLNPLAGMVLLDAVENYCEWLCFAAQEHDFFVSDTRSKKDFTRIIQGTRIRFQVLSGWEFNVLHRIFAAGAQGEADLIRCHLSSSSTHLNWGLRQLVGDEPGIITDLGYFDVPCTINRLFGKTTDGSDEQDCRGLTATIAYCWLTHWSKYDDRDKEWRMVPAPTDKEIIAIAKAGIKPVQEPHANDGHELRIAGDE